MFTFFFFQWEMSFANVHTIVMGKYVGLEVCLSSLLHVGLRSGFTCMRAAMRSLLALVSGHSLCRSTTDET